MADEKKRVKRNTTIKQDIEEIIRALVPRSMAHRKAAIEDAVEGRENALTIKKRRD